ncbi:cation:proton antiporter [Calidifontibacter terrae]
MNPEVYAAGAYLVIGLALFIGLLLPRLTARRAVSAPIVLLGIGVVAGLIPLPARLSLDPMRHAAITEQVTTVTIIVALTGVGLAIDRPLRRSRATWRRWSSTWRLLLLGMPLSIAAMTLLGWSLVGLAPGAALVLAAALAPTDPVLASDVQVEGPTTDVADDRLDEDDEMRFALTSEAGLNDGAAFPFVVGGITLLTTGLSVHSATQWFTWEIIGRTAIGVGVGWLVGTLLGKFAFRAPRRLQLAEIGDPLLIVAAPFIAYGLGELAQGWAFLSVFVCALCMRAGNPTHDYHGSMHDVIDRLEHLLTLVVLLLLGAALSGGLLRSLTWQGALLGVLLILVVRPLTGWLALWTPGGADRAGDGVLGPRERLATAFLGVRGIGTIYYLAYATTHAEIDDMGLLWSVAAFTVALSVVVHGVAATPIVVRLDRARRVRPAGSAPTAARAAD